MPPRLRVPFITLDGRPPGALGRSLGSTSGGSAPDWGLMDAGVRASRYLEWSVRSALRRYASCTWTSPSTGPDAEPVLPDGCMDLIWDGSRLIVAGPDTVPTIGTDDGLLRVGLRFRPGMGPLFFGPPAVELRDARVELAQLWPDVDTLAARLSEPGSPGVARGILEDAVADRLPSVSAPDPLVEVAVRAWATNPATAGAEYLASVSGLSARQVHRRFVAMVGYGPKYLQRVLRFQAFLATSAAPGLGLAELACVCGYSDQPHLNRETARLSGRTPAELRAARRGVRIVQDAR